MIKRNFFLVLYYVVYKILPPSVGGMFQWSNSIRFFLVSKIVDECGTKVIVDKGAYIGKGADIVIGSNSGIGENAYLQSPLIIGDYVMMGPDVRILTRSHKFDRTDVPMAVQGGSVNGVVIGNDVWIGTRVMIMPGVVVGNGVIIAAGAVVTKNLPDFSICAGVPARVVRMRRDS